MTGAMQRIMIEAIVLLMSLFFSFCGFSGLCWVAGRGVTEGCVVCGSAGVSAIGLPYGGGTTLVGCGVISFCTPLL